MKSSAIWIGTSSQKKLVVATAFGTQFPESAEKPNNNKSVTHFISTGAIIIVTHKTQ